MLEEYLTNEEGLITTNSTWTYKIPSLDNIPKQFNAKVLNTGHHPDRVLSSKGNIYNLRILSVFVQIVLCYVGCGLNMI